MSPNDQQTKAKVDWLTTVAIAAIAISIVVAFHEGVHALTCVAGGGQLLEYSALHVECTPVSEGHLKFVSGSASIANFILGALSLILLRRTRHRSTELQFFLWLFMLLNWLNGAGYWMVSGIFGFGDWATVIAGWEPNWLWRVLMAVVGTALYIFLIWFALGELGKIIGGTPDERIGRAVRLGLVSYITVVLVAVSAGLLNPYGLTGDPTIGALAAAVFGMSPLLWMMQWFRADSFAKLPGRPLEVHRRWTWVAAAVLVTSVYVFVLGPTLYF